MTTVTYHTRVPESLIRFVRQWQAWMPRIERNLYRELEAGRAVTDLKREYQRRYGINARHFNALYAALKGKIHSLMECRKRHIKQLQSSISGLEKLIRRWRKQVPRIPLACPLQQGDKTPRQILRWRLHQKQRRLYTLKARLERIQHEKPRLVFGGQKRWAA